MTTGTRKSGWQRWLFTGLVIAFLWLLAQRFADIQRLVGTLAQGSRWWIAAALVLEMAYYISLAALFQSAFALINIKTQLRHLVPIAFAFLFVNTTTTSGGTAGLALFIDDIRRRGDSAARATVGTLLAHTANYGIFALLLGVGLYYLYAQHDLTGLEIISAVILFLLVVALCSTLILGWRWPSMLLRLLGVLQRVVNGVGRWLKRPYILPETWAEQSADDFIAAAEAIAARPSRLGIIILLALGTHVLQMAVLLSLFFAFGQPVSPGLLLSGYTMSLLFMIVSPTPNGIGVVEAVVPLMYASLGMAVDQGVIITFAFRGVTFWVPMLTGFLLLRQLQMFGGRGRTLAESGQARLASVLTALMGLINVISAIQPSLLEPIAALTQFSPLTVQESGRVTAVFTGFMLLLLARGLWRHKRAAWWLSLIILVIAIGAHLLQGDNQALTLTALLLIYLVSQRSHFHALSDSPSVWQGVQVLIAAVVFTLAYGTAGFYFLARLQGEAFNFIASWRQAVLLFTTLSEPALQSQNPVDIFADSIYIVGAATLGYAVILLLRPVLLPSPATTAERRRAEKIVTAHGRSALSPLALLPDKAYYFSPGGSVVAFTHHRRTAVALGDPIGPPEDLAAAVDGFCEFCLRHDWQPIFYRTCDEAVGIYQEAGLQTLPIGQEALLDLSGLQAAELPPELGRVQVLQPPFAADLLAQLRIVSDEWLALIGREERPFSWGWFGREYLNLGVIAVLSVPSRGVVAFATAIPVASTNELAMGLLRHRRGVEPDVLAALVAALAQWGQAHGYAQLSLGMGSPERMELQVQEERPSWKRLLQILHFRMTPAGGGETQFDLQEQFASTWEPRYLAYPGAGSLPAVWAALTQTTGLS